MANPTLTAPVDAERWGSGVLSYVAMGYYQPDYEPADTDVLAAFRITPQAGVTPEEAGAAVAGEDRKSDSARAASGCVDAAQTPAENVVVIWMAGGNGPSTSMPCKFISSLNC